MSSKIRVTLIQERGYIFSATDYEKLRKTHRIIGRLIGVVVSCPRNSRVHGLPAILTPYELQLLLEKNIIELIKSVPTLPTIEHGLKYQELNKQLIREQHEFLCDNRVEASRKNIEKIILGKRKKLLKSGVSENEINKIDEQTILMEIRNSYKPNDENALVQVPTKNYLENFVLIDPESIKSLIDLRKTLKYRVFKDLWEKNEYFITLADSFGGDFLLYPGEPLYFHASHTIHVIEHKEHVTSNDLLDGDNNKSNDMPSTSAVGGGGSSRDQLTSLNKQILMAPIESTRLTATGRLNVSVNKFCVFVYLNNETNELIYQTMEWLGNNTRVLS